MDTCMAIESSERSGEVILQSKKIDGWSVESEKDKESKFIIRLPGKDQVVDKSKFDESKPV